MAVRRGAYNVNLVVENPIQSLLEKLRVIDPGAIEVFYPRVRDRADVQALRCAKSGVIFLSKPQVISAAHYAEKSAYSWRYWVHAGDFSGKTAEDSGKMRA